MNPDNSSFQRQVRNGEVRAPPSLGAAQQTVRRNVSRNGGDRGQYAPPASGESSGRRKNVNCVGNESVDSSSQNSKPSHRKQPQPRSSKQHQQPMQHDGGILCIKHLPSSFYCGDQEEMEVEGRKMRFLSGGTDGTIKLWEVIDDEVLSKVHGKVRANDSELLKESLWGERSRNRNMQMPPRLIRTYFGHKGYVNAIALLGNEKNLPSSLGSNQGSTASSSGDDFSNKKKSKTFISRFNVAASSSVLVDAFNSKKNSKKKQFGQLFVTASRDNTLRLWELGDDHCDTDPNPSNLNSRGEESSHVKSSRKLRGHECQFGTDLPGGVLCVCAVPSAGWLSSNSSSFNSSSASGRDEYQSYSQFVSGGADGAIRVWDVRSAMNLVKVPKSGMYSTVQIQAIWPQAKNSSSPPLTTLVCTGGPTIGDSSSKKRVGLFAGDAAGIIRRYSPMDKGGTRQVNHAIWWGCTGIFEGHTQGVLGLTATALPLHEQHGNFSVDDDSDDYSSALGVATKDMLISGSLDGTVRVWDAFDVRILKATRQNIQGKGTRIDQRMLKREALLEINLNDDDDLSKSRGEKAANFGREKHISVTCIATFAGGKVLAAGATDGAIRVWDVTTGIYQGAYNLGKSVQIWSLAELVQEEALPFDHGHYRRGHSHDSKEKSTKTIGILVSGDNRGKLHVLRKKASQELASNEGKKTNNDRTPNTLNDNVEKTSQHRSDDFMEVTFNSGFIDEDDDDQSLGMGTFAGEPWEPELYSRNGEVDLLDGSFRMPSLGGSEEHDAPLSGRHNTNNRSKAPTPSYDRRRVNDGY